ncbi:MAG: ABC transporter substrate-binding protein [Pseudomonadota bacterium]
MKHMLTAVLICLTAAAAAQDCGAGLRPFEHLGGTTCIPESPQRIVGLQDDEVVTPLLDLGAPVVASGFRQRDGGAPFLRGAVFMIPEDVRSSLTNLGDPNQPDFEALAAADPDLIILDTDALDIASRTGAIAPTIVLPETEFLLDYLATFARIAGVTQTYESRRAAYEARVEEVRAKIGTPAGITISQLDMYDQGMWYEPNRGALDQVLTDLGFTRPEPIAEALKTRDGFDPLSFEFLPTLDGDIIISTYAGVFGQSPARFEADWDGYAPFWRDLAGVASGEHFWVERDLYNGRTFTSLMKSLDAIELITVGREFE